MDGRLVQNSPMAIERSADLFDKCYRFTKAKELITAGMYPYFRVIESAQDPEVVIDGKTMIMVGSNNYLGLTNHPKVKAAALDLTEFSSSIQLRPEFRSSSSPSMP